MTIREVALPLLILLSLLSTSAAWAEGPLWTEQQILAPDDADEDPYFNELRLMGNSCLDGDTALTFWYSAGKEEVVSQIAYVFARDGETWTQQAELLPDDFDETDRFGRAGALDGDTIVIGAPGDDDEKLDSGAAYVFVRSGTTWTRQAKLSASDSAEDASFGRVLALDGDTAAIQAFGEPLTDDPESPRVCVVYVFVRSRTTWTQQARLVSPTGVYGISFGYSVALDGDTLIIGEGSYMPEYPTGTAQVFVRSGDDWSLQASLVPAEVEATGDAFGSSVSLDGDTAIIGATGDEDFGWRSGAAYVFVRSGTTWTQQARLLSPVGAEEDYFGSSVSIAGDNAVVSSTGAVDLGDEPHDGRAHFFRRADTGWEHIQSMLVTSNSSDYSLGGEVSIDGVTALVSETSINYDEDEILSWRGSVHAYTLEGAPKDETACGCESVGVDNPPTLLDALTSLLF